VTIYKGLTTEIGHPVPGWQGIRNAIDPEGLAQQVATLRRLRDKARLNVAECFEARQRAGDVEQRMRDALRAERRQRRSS
jgi:hypothetical protein